MNVRGSRFFITYQRQTAANKQYKYKIVFETQRVNMGCPTIGPAGSHNGKWIIGHYIGDECRFADGLVSVEKSGLTQGH